MTATTADRYAELMRRTKAELKTIAEKTPTGQASPFDSVYGCLGSSATKDELAFYVARREVEGR